MTITINSLPTEILLRILNWIDKRTLLKIRALSRFFFQLVYHPSLWREIKFSDNLKKKVTDKVIAISILANIEYPCIRHLDLTGCENITDVALKAICMSHYKTIETLIINNCPRVTLNFLNSVPLENISKIEIEGCGSVDIVALSTLLNNAKLQYLNLTKCHNLIGLSPLLRSNTFLQELNLKYSKMEDKEIISLCSKFPNLHKLILSDCYQVADEVIDQITRNCKNLKALLLDSCIELSVASLSSISRQKQLRYLNLRGCRMIDCETLKRQFIPIMPNLEFVLGPLGQMVSKPANLQLEE